MDSAGDDGGATWEGSTKTGVELWDVSGSSEYESCWPAIQKDADAVIVTYNPDNPLHERSVHLWYEFFVQEAGLTNQQCLVFAHRHNMELSRKRAPDALSRCQLVNTNFESASVITMEFDNFLKTLVVEGQS